MEKIVPLEGQVNGKGPVKCDTGRDTELEDLCRPQNSTDSNSITPQWNFKPGCPHLSTHRSNRIPCQHPGARRHRYIPQQSCGCARGRSDSQGTVLFFPRPFPLQLNLWHNGTYQRLIPAGGRKSGITEVFWRGHYVPKTPYMERY